MIVFDIVHIFLALFLIINFKCLTLLMWLVVTISDVKIDTTIGMTAVFFFLAF